MITEIFDDFTVKSNMDEVIVTCQVCQKEILLPINSSLGNLIEAVNKHMEEE